MVQCCKLWGGVQHQHGTIYECVFFSLTISNVQSVLTVRFFCQCYIQMITVSQNLLHKWLAVLNEDNNTLWQKWIKMCWNFFFGCFVRKVVRRSLVTFPHQLLSSFLSSSSPTGEISNARSLSPSHYSNDSMTWREGEREVKERGEREGWTLGAFVCPSDDKTKSLTLSGGGGGINQILFGH